MCLATLGTSDAHITVMVGQGTEQVIIRLLIIYTRNGSPTPRGGVDAVVERRVNAVHVAQLVLPHVLQLTGAARFFSIAPGFSGAALVAGGAKPHVLCC